jgi:hypothetical protein
VSSTTDEVDAVCDALQAQGAPLLDPPARVAIRAGLALAPTPALSLVWWEPGGELVVDLEEPPFRLSFTPECPRQALDVLAAISVLPAHFSTVYAIGRARGALDQWREEVNSCGT